MNNIIIYSKNKSGKTLEWKAYSDLKLNNDGHIELHIEYGQQDGKKQHKVRLTKSGKNKGKSNETTIEEQASLDLKHLYRAQLEEKGYFLSLEDYQKPKTAMLAHKFADKKHKLDLKDDQDTFNHLYYAQPKLNGIRCTVTKLEDGSLQFLSRTNKLFTPFKHIEKELSSLLNVGDILDGELFNPTMPLEYIASIVNSDSDRFVIDSKTGIRLHKEEDINFYVYDCVPISNIEMIYTDRLAIIRNLIIGLTSVILTETVIVKSLTELKELFNSWVTLLYEGAMLRDGNGIYEFNERSIYLLKYKEMFDEEFQIIDIVDSENEPGQPKFIVDLRNGQQCEVRKSGNKLDNEKYLMEKSKYLGKWLTVQYQARTKYDNLSFPVGLILRDGSFIDNVFVPSV